MMHDELWIEDEEVARRAKFRNVASVASVISGIGWIALWLLNRKELLLPALPILLCFAFVSFICNLYAHLVLRAIAWAYIVIVEIFFIFKLLGVV